jgi:chemotaxis protein methyltransferase CheR
MMPNLSQTAISPPETSLLVGKLMALLKEFAGFRASPQIQRKLERIFHHPTELAAFIKEVEKDPYRGDLIALVEDLTNHETYFFRERAHLDALEKILLPRLIEEKRRQTGIKKLTLWSAACATGEEAYTLAMIALSVLKSQGIARENTSGEIMLPADWKLDVFGTDISRQAVRIAKDARYTSRKEGLSSFRQFPPDYFGFFNEITAAAPTPATDRQTYSIKPSITRHTRFEQFNLMNKSGAPRDVDIIFCRNVLIYMDIESQKTIIRSLFQALKPGGHLILSLVDSMSVPQLFKENRQNRCVIYEKP